MGKSEVRRRRHEQIARRGKPIEHQNIEKSGNWLLILTSFLVVVCLVVAFLAYVYSTSPISAIIISDGHDAASMKWNREYNRNLQQGQRLFTDLRGPESIAVDDEGNLYTGLIDGRLIKISDVGKPTEYVRDITSDVDYSAGGGRSSKRALGMRLFQGKLYFADAYQGIFAMDLKTLAWEKIVGYNEVTPHLQFANDLAISKDGIIYFTDSCERWSYEHAVYSVLEGRCSGRVFKVERSKKGVHLLKDSLCLANGIELTRDESKLLISEHGRRRIAVIDIKSEIIEKTILLHGAGDNIRRSPVGGYWVPIPILADSNDRFLERYPLLRYVALFVINIIGEDSLNLPTINQGSIVKLNDELEIEQVHQDLEGKVAWGVSHVQEYEPGKFLLGSYNAPGIVKLTELSSFQDID